MMPWCRHIGGIDFETTAPLRWEIGAKGSGDWLEVPEGFRFQTSIPRGLRWLFSPMDRRYLRAACLHDYALHVRGWDRVSAAAPFATALRDEVNEWKALAFTIAVITWKWSEKPHARD